MGVSLAGSGDEVVAVGRSRVSSWKFFTITALWPTNQPWRNIIALFGFKNFTIFHDSTIGKLMSSIEIARDSYTNSSKTALKMWVFYSRQTDFSTTALSEYAAIEFTHLNKTLVFHIFINMYKAIDRSCRSHPNTFSVVVIDTLQVSFHLPTYRLCWQKLFQWKEKPQSSTFLHHELFSNGGFLQLLESEMPRDMLPTHSSRSMVSFMCILVLSQPVIVRVEMFQITTIISEAEKLEELKENPPPSESDINVAELVVKEKGEAVAKTFAKASKEEIVAAVGELTKAKENLLKLHERYKLVERCKLGGGIPKKDGKIDYAEDFFSRQAILTVSGPVETYACALVLCIPLGLHFEQNTCIFQDILLNFGWWSLRLHLLIY
ncbi:UNVERIFIED_CONTAM: Asparagine--tRNA ligase, cytoplasmic 3, partial [Sesamum radiatum]